MQVAELLSDLTSLRPEVCDTKAALALVNTRPEGGQKDGSSADEDDPDLQRARDLLSLHADVKLAHADGTDKELIQAREAVDRVLRGL